MNQQRTIRIGIIADTHGRFDPAIRRHFKGVDHIIHAGDIGGQSMIEQLDQIAPVTAHKPFQRIALPHTLLFMEDR